MRLAGAINRTVGPASALCPSIVMRVWPDPWPRFTAWKSSRQTGGGWLEAVEPMLDCAVVTAKPPGTRTNRSDFSGEIELSSIEIDGRCGRSGAIRLVSDLCERFYGSHLPQH